MKGLPPETDDKRAKEFVFRRVTVPTGATGEGQIRLALSLGPRPLFRGLLDTSYFQDLQRAANAKAVRV